MPFLTSTPSYENPPGLGLSPMHVGTARVMLDERLRGGDHGASHGSGRVWRVPRGSEGFAKAMR